jgi:hypothetical protein
MANVIYNAFLYGIAKQTIDWEGDVFKALLVRSTSTYTPDPDDEDLADFTGGGGVEITASGYARDTLDNAAVANDTAANRTELDCDNLNFGEIATGQTVKAVLIYKQVGGDDTTPENDPLVAYLDDDAGDLLPVATAGGPFTLTINAEGLFQLAAA